MPCNCTRIPLGVICIRSIHGENSWEEAHLAPGAQWMHRRRCRGLPRSSAESVATTKPKRRCAQLCGLLTNYHSVNIQADTRPCTLTWKTRTYYVCSYSSPSSSKSYGAPSSDAAGYDLIVNSLTILFFLQLALVELHLSTELSVRSCMIRCFISVCWI